MFSLAISFTRRNDGGFQLARRSVLIDQHAVDAVADAEFLLERLDVNIAGALLRPPDAIMAFTSRMTGASLAMSRRCSRSSVASRDAARVEFGFVLGALAVVAVDGVEDLLLRREPGRTVRPVQDAHRASGSRNRSGSAMASVTVWSCRATGKTAELAQESRARAFRFRARRRAGLRWRPAGTCNCSDSARQHVAHGDEAEIDQDLAELVAALLLQFERAVEVLLRDQLPLDEDLAETHVAFLNLCSRTKPSSDVRTPNRAGSITALTQGACFFGACIMICCGISGGVFPGILESMATRPRFALLRAPCRAKRPVEPAPAQSSLQLRHRSIFFWR